MIGAMAKAVEESDVILMCMSERYRDSQSCRAGMCKRWVVNRGRSTVPIFCLHLFLLFSSAIIKCILYLYK